MSEMMSKDGKSAYLGLCGNKSHLPQLYKPRLSGLFIFCLIFWVVHDPVQVISYKEYIR